MKKKKLNLFAWIIILGIILSIIIIFKGILILKKSKDAVKDGVSEAEQIIKNAQSDNSDPSTYVSSSALPYDLNGVAILTFLDDGNKQVGIFNGLTKDVLAKGAGRDTNTSLPNQLGNCVLYAHRDSGFNSVTTIKEGDNILITTSLASIKYKVINVFITTPEAPEIYAASDKRRVTLVTCYPFYFVGPAPQRCVVVAEEI